MFSIEFIFFKIFYVNVNFSNWNFYDDYLCVIQQRGDKICCCDCYVMFFSLFINIWCYMCYIKKILIFYVKFLMIYIYFEIYICFGFNGVIDSESVFKFYWINV